MASKADNRIMPKKTNKPSEVIRAAILDSDATRYRICQETGIEQSAMSRFMSGERGLSMEALDTLAEYFKLELVPRRPTAGKMSRKVTPKKG